MDVVFHTCLFVNEDAPAFFLCVRHVEHELRAIMASSFALYVFNCRATSHTLLPIPMRDRNIQSESLKRVAREIM